MALVYENLLHGRAHQSALSLVLSSLYRLPLHPGERGLVLLSNGGTDASMREQKY